MTAREIAEMMARTEPRMLVRCWQDLAGRLLEWTEWLIDSPALAKAIWGFLLFATGYFLGVIVNVLNR
ncbi:MAG: hypothetical protein CVU61_02015 [Deltaproteobacteria bacterium HGW-Deltaproteobacteria-19]|jgi:hypothetical protein|nr:MAG: hypothetical protein CVU61_02015 [Deltaproteobacteria bacterium HGW-Deltaproteobacteria-19]